MVRGGAGLSAAFAGYLVQHFSYAFSFPALTFVAVGARVVLWTLVACLSEIVTMGVCSARTLACRVDTRVAVASTTTRWESY